MLKKDVMKILTGREIAKAIGKDPAQVTRMPKVVPVVHRKKLESACWRKLNKIYAAYNRIQPSTGKQ